MYWDCKLSQINWTLDLELDSEKSSVVHKNNRVQVFKTYVVLSIYKYIICKYFEILKLNYGKV